LKTTTTLFDKLEKAGTYAENTLLMVILIGMILLAGTQILLRNLFDFGFFWGDEMLRLMVLWLTLAGALAASRMHKHISIEVLDRFLPVKYQCVNRIIIDSFTSLVCGLLAWQSARFVMGSYEFGDMLLRNTPAWILQSILPIGFGLMAYRHLVLALNELSKLLGRDNS